MVGENNSRETNLDRINLSYWILKIKFVAGKDLNLRPSGYEAEYRVYYVVLLSDIS